MKVTPLGIDGAWLIEAPTYPDNRGLFREWFTDDLGENTELPRFEVKQANTSMSTRGVIRGIHYSNAIYGQSKIVTCTFGSILDAVVDLREDSETFGKAITVELKANDGLAIFIESGLGHAFQALDEHVAVTYLLNKKYNPKMEFGINPMDKEININWKAIEVIVSERDSNSPSLSELKSTESH